jgi:threonine dehydratase
MEGMIPKLSEIERAREVLRRYLEPTRLVAANSLTKRTGARVFLKLESELPTGSFKPRGAIYALHKNAATHAIAGVVAASTGNHGAAVAYAARLLKIPATIFLPENPNPVKRTRIAELGATIVEAGRDLSAAAERAAAFAREHNFYFLNDASDPDVPAGAGTIALEILDALPEADAIFVPMGDTALVRGVAAAAKGRKKTIRIVGVQAAQAPSYFLSWKEGRAIATETCDTIADGLATRQPLEANVRAIRELVDEVRLVSEEEMLDAMRVLLREENVVAEPAGAAATAALLQDAAPYAGKNVVLLVTGANAPPEIRRKAEELPGTTDERG